MKKILWIVTILLVLLYAGYIFVMALFESPIRINMTNSIRLSADTHEIELPWYFRWVSYYGRIEGYDANGNHYTEYCYLLPDIFESAEMSCIVSWETGDTIAFMGNSRGMEVIYLEYPSVTWERYMLPLHYEPIFIKRIVKK